jgi:phosphotransferase system enzyme I (PtsI)
MTLHLNSIGISRGIAIGKIHLLRGNAPEASEHTVPPAQIEREVLRFRHALQHAASQLRDIRDAIPPGTPKGVVEFMDTHLLMLNDNLLSQAPIKIIRERRCNAEWALKLQCDELVSVFNQMNDPYLRTRRDDVNHVIQRVQRMLMGETDPSAPHGSMRGSIVVAKELTPADIVTLHQQHIGGFIAEYGGPLSHTAILARSLRIPGVVGIHDAHNLLQEDERVIVDGATGVVLVGANAATLKSYRRRQIDQREQHRRLGALREVPAVTRDGHAIALRANIELKEDIRALKQVGAEGVGLYRTEFLYLEREHPADEEEQLDVFRRVLRALKPKPLTIRTLDLGSDKECSAAYTINPAPNPALGLRAIRRCLKEVELFRPQLRAILRASAYGPVRLMFPMLTTTTELRAVLDLLEVIKEELRKDKKRFDPGVPVGAMIEVPAAALCAQVFARRLDFLSIGTNDLIQYTMAIDRLDDEVNYLYNPLHPAVLKLISMTLDAGRRTGIPVSMCGEMAGEVRYTRLLLGMGLREFSMPPATLLEVKEVINNATLSELGPRCREILASQEPEQVATLVEELNV